MAASRRGGVRLGLLVMLPLALGRPSDGEAPACPGRRRPPSKDLSLYIGIRGSVRRLSTLPMPRLYLYVAGCADACRHEAPRNGVGPHGERGGVNGAAAVQRLCCATKHHLSAKWLSCRRDKPKFCAIVSLLRSSRSFVERRGQASTTDPSATASGSAAGQQGGESAMILSNRRSANFA